MPKVVENTDEYRNATFTRVDLSGATLRDVDLSGAKIVDALLVNAEFSGLISGMTVNGVAIAPLVEAELDRLHPERLRLRATDPDGLRDGWATVESIWAPTIALAERMPAAELHQRVDGEWSLVETLRHLIFVIDSWFGRAVLGESRPYHPFGLAPAFLDDEATRLGLRPDADPSFDEVLAVRLGRVARVRDYLATVTDDMLGQPRHNDGDGYPPPSQHTVLRCLLVIMDEEWNHHQYAIRDLAALTT